MQDVGDELGQVAFLTVVPAGVDGPSRRTRQAAPVYPRPKHDGG